MFFKDSGIKSLGCVFAGLLSSTSFACQLLENLSWSKASIPLQVGGFFASNQHHTQNINIQGLVGDQFSDKPHRPNNVLVGLGYYLNGYEATNYSLLYGLNAYYLARTRVQGSITQEQLFTNLAYSYSLTNYPLYVAAKALLKSDTNYQGTIDLGIGPNFIRTNRFGESSLDGGITIPDHAFAGKTKTVFSATAGVGLRLNEAIGHTPLECGYRFYYLGKGSFRKLTNQLLNTLETNDNYANAVVCSVTI